MAILVVDDLADNRTLLEEILINAGFGTVLGAESAGEAFELLGLGAGGDAGAGVDLVLMDVRMPGIDGIEACRHLKASERYRDVPVIMVTAQCDTSVLDDAFAAGACDYVTKPYEIVELLARVRSALALKRERDRRKARERELVEAARRLAEANAALEELSTHDALTGLANRRRFDEFLAQEWRRAMRDGEWLSILLVDVDHFKDYNDAKGHQAGDECLRRVADVLRAATHRSGDLAARYGGEEFVVVLAQTDVAGALAVAEAIRGGVAALAPPASAPGAVTVSLGVAGVIPGSETTPSLLVSAADFALYQAKQNGRNCTRIADESLGAFDVHRLHDERM